MFTDDVATMAN